jgi:hypothetical protein
MEEESMKAVAAVAALFGVVIVFALGVVLAGVGYRNGAVRFENAIEASYTNNQNVYDNGWKEVKEKAQVPTLAESQLEKLYKSALQGRYGDKGSQAVVQFIQEQNPHLEPALYVQIQQSVEAFRRSFTSHQTTLISQKQAYKNYLDASISGIVFNGFFGFPHIDLTKFDIITSDQTQQDFETKKSQPIELIIAAVVILLMNAFK